MDTVTLLANVRSAIANTVAASAQLRVSGKQCLCTWGEYAFNQHGANVEQNGVHGTTEAVLALHRMASATARPCHYSAKFLGGHAALLGFLRDGDRADDFVRAVKLFPWITALARHENGLRNRQKLVQRLTESQDLDSGGWPFDLTSRSRNRSSGEIWPTVLALEALRSLALPANDAMLARGEAFLLDGLKVSSDQYNQAAPLLYAAKNRSAWLRRNAVKDRLVEFLEQLVEFSYAPSLQYSYYPPSKEKAKPSYCTLPVGIYYLHVLYAVESSMPALVTDRVRAHAVAQLDSLRDAAFASSDLSFSRLGHFRAAIDFLTELLANPKVYETWSRSAGSQKARTLPAREAISKVEPKVYSPKRQISKRADVLILTAANIEYEVAIELAGIKAADVHSRRVEAAGLPFIDLGWRSCSAWLFRCKQGSVGPTGSMALTDAALREIKPFAVIAVGIAFGMKPDKQKLGDVLVADQIQLYEVVREQDEGPLPRGDKVTAAGRIGDWLKSCEADWGADSNTENKPAVHRGLVLSGEKLMDSKGGVERLKRQEPEAIGGEMEGAGLYSAATINKSDWHLVKGICDWGHGKSKEHQRTAAVNAFDFVYYALAHKALGNHLKDKR